MRSLRFALLATALAASTAFASPTDPKNGVEYVTLAQPQPVQTTGKKVEVIEFFMYHCPHCNALEPSLEQWVKKQGGNIQFKRIHLPSTGPNDPEAHLHVTLEAMGKAEEFQPKVFKAWHVDHLRLNTDAAIIDWVAKNGIDRAKFLDMWNSFGVITKLHRLPQLTSDYKVDGVPTVIIDGKYQTAPSIVYNSVKATSEPVLFQATLQVMDALVAKAAKSK
ncbi:thiol:disulfide interchange protein DsbA/DsbL [Massilia pinisoli]|uniref:Thiol:disulfide interchange protein n=1 Tax=Massilia pinisoli TaxID=1772194 RepID=A0ABT1ZZR7_9BURK|nr:thiol:disulfide interchange protein DsbA/DsbL [Massilia pinisoli]MCS0585411.1 thiol:disulfide interchange protein DsbA/DsbL [Massilia pinisoli]